MSRFVGAWNIPYTVDVKGWILCHIYCANGKLGIPRSLLLIAYSENDKFDARIFLEMHISHIYSGNTPRLAIKVTISSCIYAQRSDLHFYSCLQSDNTKFLTWRKTISMTCFSVDKYIKYRRQTKPAFAGKLLLKTSFETALHCTGSNIRAFSQNAISSKKAQLYRKCH